MAKKRKQIGTVGVDSGMVFVGDPCYFWSKDNGQLPIIEQEAGTWVQFASRFLRTPFPHHITIGNLGIAVTSGGGDGVYPVWVTIEDGTILSLTIDFCVGEDDDIAATHRELVE